MSFNPSLPLRDTIVNLRASKIREIAKAGVGRSELLTIWFGEPDEVAPLFIADATS